jgi:hypothetical protein
MMRHVFQFSRILMGNQLIFLRATSEDLIRAFEFNCGINDGFIFGVNFEGN